MLIFKFRRLKTYSLHPVWFLFVRLFMSLSVPKNVTFTLLLIKRPSLFLQEPCLPRSLEGPLGLLCQLLLLLQPPLLEPALAMASLHPWLRPSAPRPPPPPRVPARLSPPPAGHPNSGCPLYRFPRPLFHREAQQEYTVEWETDMNNKVLHNKYLINPVNLLAVQSLTQSPRILWQHVPKCTAMHFI